MKQQPDKVFKERLNYIKTESGVIVGCLVNVPAVAQGDTLEEVTEALKSLAQVHVNLLQETLNSDEPFEFREMNQEEWMNQDKPYKKPQQ